MNRKCVRRLRTAVRQVARRYGPRRKAKRRMTRRLSGVGLAFGRPRSTVRRLTQELDRRTRRGNGSDAQRPRPRSGPILMANPSAPVESRGAAPGAPQTRVVRLAVAAATRTPKGQWPGGLVTARGELGAALRCAVMLCLALDQARGCTRPGDPPRVDAAILRACLRQAMIRQSDLPDEPVAQRARLELEVHAQGLQPANRHQARLDPAKWREQESYESHRHETSASCSQQRWQLVAEPIEQPESQRSLPSPCAGRVIPFGAEFLAVSAPLVNRGVTYEEQ